MGIAPKPEEDGAESEDGEGDEPDGEGRIQFVVVQVNRENALDRIMKKVALCGKKIYVQYMFSARFILYVG